MSKPHAATASAVLPPLPAPRGRPGPRVTWPAPADYPFLRDIGLTHWLRLDGDLAEIDPL